jgi:hypothetical protein
LLEQDSWGEIRSRDNPGQRDDIAAGHRIVSDPGRLTHAWYGRMLASGIADMEYVEIV